MANTLGRYIASGEVLRLTDRIKAAESGPELRELVDHLDRFGAGRVFRTSNLVRSAAVSLCGVVLLAIPGSGTATRCVILTFGAVSGLLAEVSFIAVEKLSAETGRRLGTPQRVTGGPRTHTSDLPPVL